MATVSVFDVAVYILEHAGEMSAMKLQKLVYYSQAWSLVWTDAPLFREQVRAWANGPVVGKLYNAHRGLFTVKKSMLKDLGDSKNLTDRQRLTIRTVVDYYGPHDAQWLSDLTHFEAPWRDARKGLGPTERGNAVITHAAMAEFYGSLPPDAI